MRRASSCGDVDVALGWQDSMSLKHCDECMALGGVYSEDGRKWRERYVQSVVLTVRRAGIHSYKNDVREAMIERWTDPEDRIGILASIQAADKKPKTTRWLWLAWEGGVPWPRRPFIAFIQSCKVFFAVMRTLKEGGCGCNHHTKQAWRWFAKRFR